MENKFKCPLCESPLSESRYYEIIGVWEEKKKFEKDLKKQLIIAEETKKKLLEEKKAIQQNFIKEKSNLKKQLEKEKLEMEKRSKKEIIKAKKEGEEEGKKHEKKRSEKLSKMLEGKMKEIESANKTIGELKEQIKKGTTPQIEGLNLEEELVKELKNRFPEDDIIHKGHAGDILHYIMYKRKQIGLIVYECKKTQKFQKSYITQIKNDVVKKTASFGVLVTTASEKDRAGFWIDNDILIVHPYGTIYIAEIIRRWIVSIYALKLNETEMNECAKKLLEYIKSDRFKNAVRDTIYRAKELNELLIKEAKTHENIWKKRKQHYDSIYRNSDSIKNDSLAIVRNEEENFEDTLEKGLAVSKISSLQIP